jgi:hypothetical protein
MTMRRLSFSQEDNMFLGATHFNQDITQWNISSGQSFVSSLGLRLDSS